MPRRPGETTLLRRKRERLEASSTIVRFRRKPADPSLQFGSGWEAGCRTLFLDQSKKMAMPMLGRTASWSANELRSRFSVYCGETLPE
jgi:hypothetical protein